MITFKDYEDDKGNVDWKAYDAAQVAAGEKCEKCGTHIIFSKGFMAECGNCKALSQDHGEVSHDGFIRCPRCGHSDYVHGNDYDEIFEEGEHQFSCTECDYDFEISTHVSFTFDSPARLESWNKCEDCDEWYEETISNSCGLCLECTKKQEEEAEEEDAGNATNSSA